ncbi:MAG: hypothetical protein ACRDNF_06010, partial [Streptosporangiaceae bacterium]
MTSTGSTSLGRIRWTGSAALTAALACAAALAVGVPPAAALSHHQAARNTAPAAAGDISTV